MPKRNEKSAAVLTIFGPGRMTIEGRKALATWLRRQANNLVGDDFNYTRGRFTARYLYVDKEYENDEKSEAAAEPVGTERA
jgi:hypothetical protein